MPSRSPISEIDPTKGQLLFRGIDATHLAKTETIEAVLHLLLYGQLPTKQQLSGLVSVMAQQRSHSREVLEELDSVCLHPDSNGLMILAHHLGDHSERFNLDVVGCLLFFVALTPVIVAAQWRTTNGGIPILPKKNRGHADNLLNMLDIHGGQDLLRDFQTCLILHVDDPQNPSLSILEEKVKAGASISESLVSALEEHSKPLHHGAGWEAFKAISEIGDASEVREVLEKRIERGERIFGLGHRVYRTIDPRAVVLREILQRHTVGTSREPLFNIIETMASEGSRLLMERKGLTVYPNVDLYNAAVYSVLGIPAEMNTQMFAVSRVCGWAAHILELENKLGRERAEQHGSLKRST